MEATLAGMAGETLAKVAEHVVILSAKEALPVLIKSTKAALPTIASMKATLAGMAGGTLAKAVTTTEKVIAVETRTAVGALTGAEAVMGTVAVAESVMAAEAGTMVGTVTKAGEAVMASVEAYVALKAADKAEEVVEEMMEKMVEAAEKAAEKALEAADKGEETAEKLMKAAEKMMKAMAAEAAAWEAVMLEAKAWLEAAVKAEAEAIKEVEKAAGHGARIGGGLIARIEVGLEAVLGVLKAKTGDLLVEYEMLLQRGVPTVYLMVLAGLLMTLDDAVGIKLVLVALNFMGLSGSEVAKKVAKEAKEIVDELHKKVGKLIEDSPNMMPTNKEADEPLIEKMYQHLDSTKRDIEKLKHNLEELERLEKDAELKGGEEKK